MDVKGTGADEALLERGRTLYRQGMGRIATGTDRAAGRLLLQVAADLLSDATVYASSPDLRARAHLGRALAAIALHEDGAVVRSHLREMVRHGRPGLMPSLIVGLDSAAAAHLGAGDLDAARVAAQLCEQIRAAVPAGWLPMDDEARAAAVAASIVSGEGHPAGHKALVTGARTAAAAHDAAHPAHDDAHMAGVALVLSH